MPVWLIIIINVITVLIAVAGAFGLTTYAQTRQKHKAELRNAEEDRRRIELEELDRQKRESAMRTIVREELSPVKTEVKEIKENTKKSLEADVLALRCNMKNIKEEVESKGFADVGDKITMKELYSKYGSLGGNEFKAFVDRWYNLVESAPEEKPVRKTTKKSSK